MVALRSGAIRYAGGLMRRDSMARRIAGAEPPFRFLQVGARYRATVGQSRHQRGGKRLPIPDLQICVPRCLITYATRLGRFSRWCTKSAVARAPSTHDCIVEY